VATSRSLPRVGPVALAACLLVACGGGDDEGATGNTQLSPDAP
jgi:hypothetical protein